MIETFILSILVFWITFSLVRILFPNAHYGDLAKFFNIFSYLFPINQWALFSKPLPSLELFIREKTQDGTWLEWKKFDIRPHISFFGPLWTPKFHESNGLWQIILASINDTNDEKIKRKSELTSRLIANYLIQEKVIHEETFELSITIDEQATTTDFLFKSSILKGNVI
ncbi:hypothetical protein AWW67_01290 [Roseivirga seohaensis]|uniref:Uncharacterized protein n=1 Tax=Roseivirga seohaensis TaxID=1914963 RepID=A0A150Y1A4_9BACT|nr:hypothetical protein [Roseivirga seohaensis]KYG84706.1 hypothetical protein AWW67_01290 [Roseivirga seohaensis]